MEKVRLKVLGFSFNQTQTGTYGLVLSEEMGRRRLMVIVGTPEAQSIAFVLQHTIPPRPLTHDLFRSFMGEFDITLLEALVYKFEDGIFFSKLMFEQHGAISTIESRTSDAVALALRANAPIYTTEDIMQELGVVFSEKDEVLQSPPSRESSIDDLEYEDENTVEELQQKLQEAIEQENYEQASLIRDELIRKGKNGN
ncbi:MAG: DUF151 domain-containing protein [Dysgonamonadaceae bacterium]